MTEGANCPTCGQPLPPSRSANQLLSLLQDGRREVYKGQDGLWWVTYGGAGPWPDFAVRELVSAGKIRPVYSDLPDACFHVGRTIDSEKTLRGREAGKGHRFVAYVDA